MGSVSDYEVMADAVAMLGQFGVDFEKRVVELEFDLAAVFSRIYLTAHISI